MKLIASREKVISDAQYSEFAVLRARPTISIALAFHIKPQCLSFDGHNQTLSSDKSTAEGETQLVD